jgi:alpha-tubulin suppressor-like RCC1 family protein
MTLIQNRATIGKVMILGFLLATLMTIVLSAAPPAGAAVPSGKAYGWGYNNDGQLGNGTSGVGTYVEFPGAVKNLTGAKSVKAGCDHGLALKTDGTVYAWGRNLEGQLGNGTNDSSDVPVKAKIDNVKAISAGCGHSLALKENGTVWAWGYNRFGQLGNDTSDANTDRNVPVKVATLGTGAKGVAAGDDFSVALMKDGTVRSWGDNYFGQLGNGTSGADTNRTKPVSVANLSGVGAVAAGGNHSLALLASGRVKSWGYNFQGQLGNGTHGDSTDRRTPGNVIGLEDVRSITGGSYHSLAVLESGRVRSWGDSTGGLLGNGSVATESDVPVAVKNLTNVTNIDGGDAFTLAATQ